MHKKSVKPYVAGSRLRLEDTITWFPFLGLPILSNKQRDLTLQYNTITNHTFLKNRYSCDVI